MKKLKILVFILAVTVFGCSQIKQHEKVLILIDPTISKLKDIKCLVDQKCIDIPDLRIIGLYNRNQRYNFEDSKRFIEEKNMDYMELTAENLNISTDSLFIENCCTSKFHELFSKSDGIIFTGGPDVPPSLYNEKTCLYTDVESFERLYELSFLYHLAGSEKPFLDEKPDYMVLCICLGMQSLNVALGGSLIQDIPSQLYNLQFCEDMQEITSSNHHCNYWSKLWDMYDLSSYTFHPLDIMPGSFLDKYADASSASGIQVMSSHHQCINKLGKELKVTALSEDGKVIEVIEHEKYPNVIAVQFHPENRFLIDNTRRIFKKGDKPLIATDLVNKETINFHRSFWKYLSTLLINSK